MAEEKKKVEVSFEESGNKVIMRQNHPLFEMDSRELLVQIDNIENAINNSTAQIEKIHTQIKLIQEEIEENHRRLKELKKFEGKMLNIQESKAKTIYAEIKEICKKEIEEEYKYDKALTEEQNKCQMYALLQRKIGTNKKAAEELAPKIIQRLYFKESIIENPF